MTARILVVDDVPATRRLLEARLLAEYFEVLTAESGEQALTLCRGGGVDVVLLDVVLPDIDGFEVCRRLKDSAATAHIPIVMVTGLDQTADRVRGLEVGADDFLTKPVNQLQLVSRVKNLVRLKMLGDELRLRSTTSRGLGVADLVTGFSGVEDRPPRALLIDDDRQSADTIDHLMSDVALTVCRVPSEAVAAAAAADYDCVMISTGLAGVDPLRLCSQLRTGEGTRHLPIMLLVADGEDAVVTRGLDIGVNDYLSRPPDAQELFARLRTQVRRKRYNEQLRANVTQTMELAVIDPLTGLHNRRYLDSHLRALFARAAAQGRPLSMMMLDLDGFKGINDVHGHEAGDDVLREFAVRLRRNVRSIDLACRYGGEEFLVIMPDTDGATAHQIAERVRCEVAALPFQISACGGEIAVTVSVGIATLHEVAEGCDGLLRRADMALYEAKNGGRNRVVARAA